MQHQLRRRSFKPCEVVDCSSNLRTCLSFGNNVKSSCRYVPFAGPIAIAERISSHSQCLALHDEHKIVHGNAVEITLDMLDAFHPHHLHFFLVLRSICFANQVHDVIKGNVSLAIVVYPIERELEIAFVDLALRQASCDKLVPTNLSFRLSHAQGIEDILHVHLCHSTEGSIFRGLEQNLLQVGERNLTISFIELLKLNAQVINLLWQQCEAQHFAQELPHIRKFLEPDQCLDDIRIELVSLIIFLFGVGLNPLVPLCSLGIGTICGILGQGRANKILGQIADIIPDFGRLKGNGRSQDVFSHFEQVFAVNTTKGCVSTEQQKGNDSDGPYITLFVVGALDDFRGNRVRSANCF
mmetsp:Transcript_30533/g.50416  ORF Transcript_30533/g.50416 Transcript_30533/m.50416 type:complete len:354 (-) Transcript_30533:1175-2236(-)